MEALSVSLDTLGNGAAVERFNYELARVLRNIVDINTDPKAVRSVTLKVSLKPSDERNFAVADIQVTSKLAPIKPATTSMHISEGMAGNVRATEFNPQQQQMPFQQNININKEG